MGDVNASLASLEIKTISVKRTVTKINFGMDHSVGAQMGFIELQIHYVRGSQTAQLIQFSLWSVADVNAIQA